MSTGGPPRPLRILATAAGYFFGGLFTLSLASSVAMRSLQSFMEAKRVSSTSPISSFFPFRFTSPPSSFLLPFNYLQKKVAPPCASCKGKGFYGCKLCKGKSTIEWSPLYDPIVINPCLCPTCEGNKSMEHNCDFDQVSLIALEIENKVQEARVFLLLQLEPITQVFFSASGYYARFQHRLTASLIDAYVITLNLGQRKRTYFVDSSHLLAREERREGVDLSEGWRGLKPSPRFAGERAKEESGMRSSASDSHRTKTEAASSSIVLSPSSRSRIATPPNRLSSQQSTLRSVVRCSCSIIHCPPPTSLTPVGLPPVYLPPADCSSRPLGSRSAASLFGVFSTFILFSCVDSVVYCSSVRRPSTAAV
ncbi:hypothetical protein ZIOFF_050939 [Zingiber officinale]|uniref:Uncharacterized protein n=1 Tax=Zingiber officinale TaxID=94328 RepID=A0A8J5KTY2_ZINOF|nr:hypothetical protein ZIOFF_050939 [Zingiber officinale]